jgi:hypothetical protein
VGLTSIVNHEKNTVDQMRRKLKASRAASPRRNTGITLDEQESLVRKTELDRMAAMLSRQGGRGYCVSENLVPYGTKPEKVDPDPDPGPDFDFEKEKPQRWL